MDENSGKVQYPADRHDNGARRKMNDGVNPIYKTMTVALSSLMVGLLIMLIPLVLERNNAVTPETLKANLAPMQTQLDDHSRQLGEIKQSVVQLEIDTGRISEKLNIPAHPASSTP